MRNPITPEIYLATLLQQMRAIPAATLPELEAAAGLPPHSCLLSLCRLQDAGRVAGGELRPCRITGYLLRTWSLTAGNP